MAVQDGYGKSSGSESLVFAYDLKDTVNSFRGEPTTNLVATIASYYGGNVSTSYANGQYQTSAIVINGTDNTVPSRNYSQFSGTTTDTNSQTYWTIQGNSVVNESNQTVSFSVYLKGSGTCHLATYNDQCCYQVGPDITLTNTWTRYSITKTISTFSDYHWVAVRGITTSTNVFISSAQWERNSHSTPFTTSSRSNTQGLLDLTGNKTINLSSASFDNNAQIVFDGTDDYISFGNTDMGLSGATQATMEIVVKIDQLKPTANAYQQVFGFRNNSDFDFFFLVFESSQNGLTEFRLRGQNGVVLDLNPNMLSYVGNYVHIVFTISTSARVVYFNGQSVASSTGWSSSFSASSIFDVGRYGAGNIWFLDGNIPVAKIYNRALTSTEVSNNYLKYKRQYGLT